MTTVKLTVALVVVLNAVAIAFAVLLNHAGLKYRVYRTIIFAPLMIAPVVAGFLWRVLLYQDGVVNNILEPVGIGPVHFLSDPTLALASLAFVMAWQSVGFITVIYLAALQTIPAELYEAGRIDGAGGRALFRHVTVPLLAPAITLNVILVVISTLREYDHVLALTGGGPFGATETIVWRIIREGFFAGRLGSASAMSVLLMLSLFVTTSVLVSLLRRREYAV